MIDSISRTGLGISRYVIGRFLRSDLLLLTIITTITAIGFIALYSAGYSFPWRVDNQIRNILVATICMFIVAMIPIKFVRKLAPPLFIIGCALLILTLVAGITVKGATRWINIGIRIQPSELMKLAVPMMLALYYQNREEGINTIHHITAGIILLIPVALILKQPDLGTAILVGLAGFSVIFFAGLNIKFIIGLLGTGIALMPFIWNSLHDYQKERVMTLLDPTTDPLGKGFHTIQSLIAIGSGGISGKGWMEGTQAHLDFIPERTSDFLFAVYGEEFGFIGSLILIFLYTILVARSFYIAAYADNRFNRLLAGAIGTIFFSYTFVNIGMVSGILPVVGVPLPFMSYGGTALLTLGICTGLLLSISADSRR